MNKPSEFSVLLCLCPSPSPSPTLLMFFLDIYTCEVQTSKLYTPLLLSLQSESPNQIKQSFLKTVWNLLSSKYPLHRFEKSIITPITFSRLKPTTPKSTPWNKKVHISLPNTFNKKFKVEYWCVKYWSLKSTLTRSKVKYCRGEDKFFPHSTVKLKPSSL